MNCQVRAVLPDVPPLQRRPAGGNTRFVPPHDRSVALGLLSAIAALGEVAHTEASVGARLVEVLSGKLPLVALELVSASGRQRWDGSSGAAVASITIEVGASGALVMHFAQPPEIDEALRAAMSSVLGATFAQARSLARVAALSRRALADRERLREQLAENTLPLDFVAVSPAMRTLFFDTIPEVAREDVTVLLSGETGAGKEVVAQRIHALSRRARRPMLTVNCATLPETLAESALFGHERGAFTGAIAKHAGLFERAHGGTLLLDEVGELSPAMQARLLRVLDRGEIDRVGGTTPVRTDVRVIAATHRDLAAMTTDGSFRQDLFYRLSVVPLAVPPLRERVEDIGPLAIVLLTSAARRMGRATAPRLTDGDRARLEAWSWPGNVRELQNLMERSLILTRGETLALPPGWDRAAAGQAAPAPAAGGAPTFDESQRRILREALEASGGRIHGKDGAAARLGLRPTTLQAKLTKLGVARATKGSGEA